MEKLQQFVDNWNNSSRRLKFSDELLNWYVDECEAALVETFSKQPPKETPSVSGLGYPAMKQALMKIGIHEGDEDTFAGKLSVHFYMGKVLEAMVIAVMHESGLDVHSHQKEVEFYKGVKGHIDFVYGDEAVIDVKSMSRPYFSKFTELPNDDRAYVTQVLCYREALGLPHAYILAIDKWFGEMALVEISDETMEYTAESHIARAKQVIDLLEKTHTLDDVLSLFPIPKPVIDRKISTKYKIVPPALKYGMWKNLFYEMTQPENPLCEYVRRVHKVEEIHRLASVLLVD